MGFAVNAGGNPAADAYGAYIEAVREPGGGATFCMELDITNLDDPIATEATPYSLFNVEGNTGGIWLAAGGDTTMNPGVKDANFGYALGSNGSKFRKGIVLQSNALVAEGSGRKHGILLPFDTAVEWYHFNGGLALSVVSQVSDDGHKQELRVADEGLTLRDDAGTVMFRAQWVDNAANYVNAAASAGSESPSLQAQGTATNLSLRVYGKGSGGVIIADGASATKIQVSTAGIGFFGKTPVARPTGVGTDAASIHAALVDLGLITA